MTQAFEIVEYYQGARTVLDTSDDEGDAYRTRDWHRDQWSCQATARQCVVVEKKAR